MKLTLLTAVASALVLTPVGPAFAGERGSQSQTEAQETQIPGTDESGESSFPGEATSDVQETQIPGAETSSPMQDESMQDESMQGGGSGTSSESGGY